MVRTYSDQLIVLEVDCDEERGVPHTIVTAETQYRNKPKEVKIHFYGKLAEQAGDRLIPGMRFTYRGYVALEDAEPPKLVAATFTPIA